MRFSSFLRSTLVSLACAGPSLSFADYTYQETTQITGGSVMSMMKMAGMFSSQAKKAGEPIVSTIYLKGNRMARVSPESVEIIDLDKETITNIDVQRKNYTVMTFQQMREQFEAARARAEKEPAKHGQASAPRSDDVKMSFDVKVRKTGLQKQVSGLPASEAILTMTMKATDQKAEQSGSMAVTNDMWMVPEIPGYGEVREFQKRLAAKMAWTLKGAGMDFTKVFAQNPGASQAMTDMDKEMQKLDGVPVKQVMRMGTTANGQPLPAASEAPLPADSSPAMPNAGDVAKQSAVSAITGRFGLGGFGKKKADGQPGVEKTSAGTTPGTPAILMESETITSSFSSNAVDESHFEVPAGYKLVANPSMAK